MSSPFLFLSLPLLALLILTLGVYLWVRRRKKPSGPSWTDEMAVLHEELVQSGVDISFEHFDPTIYIGSALKLADHYHLTLHRGLDFGHCIASLPREQWRSSIPGGTDPWLYCDFVKRDPESILCINGWGETVQEAVCKCLVRARKAGVI